LLPCCATAEAPKLSECVFQPFSQPPFRSRLAGGDDHRVPHQAQADRAHELRRRLHGAAAAVLRAGRRRGLLLLRQILCRRLLPHWRRLHVLVSKLAWQAAATGIVSKPVQLVLQGGPRVNKASGIWAATPVISVTGVPVSTAARQRLASPAGVSTAGTPFAIPTPDESSIPDRGYSRFKTGV
jgi:hypothetical protein